MNNERRLGRGIAMAAGALGMLATGLSGAALNTAMFGDSIFEAQGRIFQSSSDHQRPLNINLFATDAMMRREMARGGVRTAGSYTKHRAPGERAHRRWRLARASGQHNAARG